MNQKLALLPCLKAWMKSEQESRVAHQKVAARLRRGQATMFGLWLAVLLAGTGALLATTSNAERETRLTDEVNRRAVVARWDGQEDMGAWVSRELFVSREARNLLSSSTTAR